MSSRSKVVVRSSHSGTMAKLSTSQRIKLGLLIFSLLLFLIPFELLLSLSERFPSEKDKEKSPEIPSIRLVTTTYRYEPKCRLQKEYNGTDIRDKVERFSHDCPARIRGFP